MPYTKVSDLPDTIAGRTYEHGKYGHALFAD